MASYWSFLFLVPMLVMAICVYVPNADGAIHGFFDPGKINLAPSIAAVAFGGLGFAWWIAVLVIWDCNNGGLYHPGADAGWILKQYLCSLILFAGAALTLILPGCGFSEVLKIAKGDCGGLVTSAVGGFAMGTLANIKVVKSQDSIDAIENASVPEQVKRLERELEKAREVMGNLRDEHEDEMEKLAETHGFELPETKTCAICMNTLGTIDVTYTGCHVYHTLCIRKMLKTSTTCPECRRPIVSEIINRFK